MSQDSPYHNASQQLVLAVYTTLCLRPLCLWSVEELMAAVAGEPTRDQVFRALHNLASAGYAEQHHRAWRMTAEACRLAEQVRRAIADLHHHYLEAADAQRH